MATNLYLTSDVSVVYSPATFKGAWDSTTGAVTQRLHTNRVGDGAGVTRAETSVTNNFDQLLYRGVTDPLLANTTISGTLDAILMVSESDAAANMVLHMHVWVTQGNSDTVRGTLLTDFIDTTEWTAHASAYYGMVVPQQSLTSVNAQAGDRVVVEIGYQAQNTVTTSYTGRVKYGGLVSDATGSESAVTTANTACPFLTFSTTLVFTPTYIKLTNSAAPVTPGATRGTYDNSGSAVDKYLSLVEAGTATTLTLAETSDSQYDILFYRGVTDALAGQTITASGFTTLLRMFELSSSADAFQYIHMYVMKPDGSVRGTLITNTEAATEVGTLTSQTKTFTLTSVVASDGDRIVLEVGVRFKNVTAVSQSASLGYGETVGDLSQGMGISTTTVSWVRFDQHLIWSTGGFARSFVVMAG